WLCLLLGYMTMINDGVSEWSFLGGGLGYTLATLSEGMFGWGTFLILILTLFIFIIFFFNITAIPAFQVKDPKPMGNDAIMNESEAAEEDDALFSTYTDESDNWPQQTEAEPTVEKKPVEIKTEPKPEPVLNGAQQELKLEVETPVATPKNESREPVFTVEEP